MSELTVPQIDFSALGQLPGIYKQNQADALRQQTLANLGQGGTADANALLRSGDLSLAQLGINLQNRTADQERQARQDTFQREESARAQRNADRSYGLQARASARADEGPVEQAGYRAQVAQKYGIDPNTPEGRAFVISGKLPDSVMGNDVSATATQRAAVAKQYGVDPASAEGRAFILTGKLPEHSMFDPAPSAAPVPANPAIPAPGTPPGAPAGAPPAPTAPPDVSSLDPKTGRREAFLQSLDPRAADYIKKIADYEIDPRTTSVRGGEREKLMSTVARYDPTYNQNEFGARSKAIKDFSTGPQGNIIRSFDVAIDHLDTLQKAADAMHNGDTMVLNQIRNKWREQTGSDLPTNFNALKPLVSGEVAKAVIGSNNALADREELRAPLNAAGAPGQISGVIGGYKALMAGQLKGIRKQYEDTTGKKDFDNRVRESTRKALLSGEGKSEPVKIDGYTITEH